MFFNNNFFKDKYFDYKFTVSLNFNLVIKIQLK